MNLKNQFISGLLAGMVISASAFLFIAANLEDNSGSSDPFTTSVLQDPTLDTSLSGNSISSLDAGPMMDAYKTDFIQQYNLPAGTSIGGIIGKDELKQAAAVDDGKNYVMFRFYLNPSNGVGGDDPQIGIMFYPQETSENLIRTGSGSFCPTVCNVPD